MTLCQFVEIEGKPGYQWCPVCERPRGWPNEQRRPSPLPEKLRRVCTGAPTATPFAKPSETVQSKKSPGIVTRAKSYKSARDRWVAAGRPTRTEPEMRALYTICERCPTKDFKPDNAAAAFGFAGGECGVCGCGLSPERIILNKIAWATEDCPRGHWPKVVVSEPTDRRDPDPDDGRAG